MVGGLQRGQRRDSAEDYSVQRTHRITHHQGGTAQRCPKTGTVRFLFVCLFVLVGGVSLGLICHFFNCFILKSTQKCIGLTISMMNIL